MAFDPIGGQVSTGGSWTRGRFRVNEAWTGALARSWSLRLRKAPVRERLVLEAPVIGVLLLVFLVSALVSPQMRLRVADVDLPSLIFCPFFAATGVPCLFCGITRSFLSMGRLDFTNAFIFHPLGPAIFLSLIAVTLVMAVSLATGWRVQIAIAPHLRQRLIRLATLILLLAWPLKVAVWSHVGLL